jgi:hypothetical protein
MERGIFMRHHPEQANALHIGGADWAKQLTMLQAPVLT